LLRRGSFEEELPYNDVGEGAERTAPPLRKPEAAKSRELMVGRGKSTRSVSSVGGRSARSSRSRRSRGSGRERNERLRSSTTSHSKSRSRSEDPHDSHELRREAGRRDIASHRDSGGRERRSLSRGKAARHLRPAEGYDRERDRRRSRRRSDASTRGPSVDGDASASVASRRSRASVRRDVDEEGYCAHHPDVRLDGLRRDGTRRVVRKKCPECIREDCPSVASGFSGRVDCRDRSSRDEDDRWGGADRGGKERRGARRYPHTSTSVYHESMHSSSFSAPSSQSTNASELDAFGDLGLSFQTPEEMEEEEATNRLKRRLAVRAYHFPGNTWCQDWMQYLSNTHTVLGLFFHHPLHPMGFQERLVILFGSVAIGLTISNFTCLYFIRNGIDVEEEVFTLNSRHAAVTGIPVVVVTKLMITLWTLGSFLHTVCSVMLCYVV
ncbi:hypothetical protein ACHAWF_011524, partial [Thalassiosira exigua]